MKDIHSISGKSYISYEWRSRLTHAFFTIIRYKYWVIDFKDKILPIGPIINTAIHFALIPSISLLVGIMVPQSAAAQVYINDGTDGECQKISDGAQTIYDKGTYSGCNQDLQRQTTHTTFFGSPGASGRSGSGDQSNNLSLGGILYVNGGSIGLSDYANGNGAMRIGNTATINGSSGGNSIAIGVGGKNTNKPLATQAEAQDSIAIGSNTVVSPGSMGSIAIGHDNEIKNNVLYSTVIGHDIHVSTEAGNSVALGSGVKVGSKQSVLLGSNTTTSYAIGAIALGETASVLGTEGEGKSSDYSMAIGYGARIGSSSAYAIAVGNGASATSGEAVAIGKNASAGDGKAVAIGSGNIARGNGSVAIGDPNKAGEASVALGRDNNANAANAFSGAVAIGDTNTANGMGAVALGSHSIASKESSIAAGNHANAKEEGSIALGANATANNARDVALGTGSTTEAAVQTSTMTVNGKTYNVAGTADSTVSIGKAGAERTITNVAAGRVTETSTDAVNGSQLFATNQAVNDLDNGSLGVVQRNANKDGTVLTASDGTAENPGNAQKLGNLAAGSVSSASNEAINGSQLYGVSDSVSSALGGGATVGPDGKIIAPTYTISGNSYNDVGSTFAAVDSRLTTLDHAVSGDGIKYFHTNSSGNDSKASGNESVAIGPASEASGANSIAAGNHANAKEEGSIALGANATANNARDVALGTGSTTEAAVQTSTMTVNGKTYNVAGTADSTVSIGKAGAERTITNVAAGRVTETSTDAVNGSQLFATNQAVNDLGTKVSDAAAVSKNSLQYDTDSNGNRKNSVTLQGGDADKPVVLSNVAAGNADTDAVNVKQLKDTSSQTLTSSKNYTDTKSTETLTYSKEYTDTKSTETLKYSKNYTDTKFGQLNGAIRRVRSEARRAAAIGLAAASLRYDDRPGKLSTAMGGGVWRGKGAFAFGVGYTNDHQTMRANISATTSGGNWGVGAGLSFTFN